MQTEWFIGAGLLIALLLAVEVGFRIGRRAKVDAEPRLGSQVGAVQGAVLGLLALLLGFSFAAAGGRFLERQDLITAEANAIGTAYLRADMLEEPHRGALHAALRRYTEHRIELSKHMRYGLDPAVEGEITVLHNAIWKAASEGANAKPAAMMVVLPPVNEVIDMHALRVAAGRKHVPLLVMGLLIASSVLAMGVMGYGAGLVGGRHTILYGALGVLITIALWTTIDLDHPRAGIIQLSDAPLRALRFEAPPAGKPN